MTKGLLEVILYVSDPDWIQTSNDTFSGRINMRFSVVQQKTGEAERPEAFRRRAGTSYGRGRKTLVAPLERREGQYSM